MEKDPHFGLRTIIERCLDDVLDTHMEVTIHREDEGLFMVQVPGFYKESWLHLRYDYVNDTVVASGRYDNTYTIESPKDLAVINATMWRKYSDRNVAFGGKPYEPDTYWQSILLKHGLVARKVTEVETWS